MRYFYLFILVLWFFYIIDDAYCNGVNDIVVSCERGKTLCIATFKNHDYEVIIGKNGLSERKKEGDGKTPMGEFSLSKKIFYRADKILKPKNSDYEFIAIEKSFFWSQDSDSLYYNQFIDSREFHGQKGLSRFTRSDGMYDIIIPISYNVDPVVARKGSAIFIHIRGCGKNGTHGCIKFNKNDLLKIVTQLSNDTKINIKYSN